MKFTLVWNEAAQSDLTKLPHWRTAEHVDRAMMSFASNGTGTVETTSTLGLFRMRVAGTRVLFTVDPVARMIHVWRVLPA